MTELWLLLLELPTGNQKNHTAIAYLLALPFTWNPNYFSIAK
jgi:hypothetical protein